MKKLILLITLVSVTSTMNNAHAMKDPCKPFSLGKNFKQCANNCKKNRCDEIFIEQGSWCIEYCGKKFTPDGKLRNPNESPAQLKKEQTSKSRIII